MKKYDVRFTDEIRYVERVEASSPESAKNKIIKKYKDSKLKCIKVYEAQDFICYTYSSHYNDGKYSLTKEYYAGYLNMPFGMIAQQLVKNKEEAKRFMTEHDLKNELKAIGRRVSDYKIESIKVSKEVA